MRVLDIFFVVDFEMSFEFFGSWKGFAAKTARIVLQVGVRCHVTVDQERRRERLEANFAVD